MCQYRDGKYLDGNYETCFDFLQFLDFLQGADFLLYLSYFIYIIDFRVEIGAVKRAIGGYW